MAMHQFMPSRSASCCREAFPLLCTPFCLTTCLSSEVNLLITAMYTRSI